MTIFNSNASEINHEFERSAIEEHCTAVFENFENKLLENNWELLKSNNHTTDYLHLDKNTKIDKNFSSAYLVAPKGSSEFLIIIFLFNNLQDKTESK